MGNIVSWFTDTGIKWVSGLFGLFAIAYFINDWHYAPIRAAQQQLIDCKIDCSDRLDARDKAVKAAGEKLNTLASELQECRDRQSAESLESYIKSLGSVENEDKSFDINISDYTF